MDTFTGAESRPVRVVRELVAEYGLPRLGNPYNPVDDLVFLILTNRSSPATAEAVYGQIRAEWETWDELAAADSGRLAQLLRPLGLGNKKAAQIQGALRRIAQDFGKCDLDSLRERPTADAEAYLVALPGVSRKVAKCVLMFTMEAEVLPVDVHVHRIARRLGWTARNRPDAAHDDLANVVPPGLRAQFHVTAIAHGRAICRPVHPQCQVCVIRTHCQSATA